MEVGSMIFKGEGNAPTPLPVDNYNTRHIIESALVQTMFVVHDENEISRASRFTFDSNIRKRYIARPDETEDSLVTIRRYNYIDPETVVMHNIPALFTIDQKVTKKTINELLRKGIFMSTIENIKKEKESVIQYYEEGYKSALSLLSPQERKDPRVVSSLKEQYLDFSAFPYIHIGKDPEGCPPLRVSVDDLNKNSTYYALSTTVPQSIDDVMSKTYIAQCVNYMLGTLSEKHDIHEIGLDTDVYYDYLIKEDATLFIFLHLMQF